MDRPRGREKHVSGPAKNVEKRGSGLGSGPVGSGRGGGQSSSGSRSGGGQRSGGGMMKIILLLAVLLLGGGGSLGTLLGGERIIQKVGREMVRLTPKQGFGADLAGGACLLAATALGWPASTTHTRTAVLLGVGSQADWKAVGDIVLAWMLTFPGCFIIGYGLVKLIPG